MFDLPIYPEGEGADEDDKSSATGRSFFARRGTTKLCDIVF